MLIRSPNSQMRKIASAGEMNAASATRHPHMAGRLRQCAAVREERVSARVAATRAGSTSARIVASIPVGASAISSPNGPMTALSPA